MSTNTGMNWQTLVPSHLGVKIPATPAPNGALDDEELFIVEGSENWRSTPGQPEEREK